MPRGKAARVELSKEEREALERNVRRRKSAQALSQRSRIILLASEGLTNGTIAAKVGLVRETVGIWRNRFVKERLEGLLDEPRIGRPREIDDDQIEAVVVATLESKPEAATQWSTRSLAKKMGLSQSAVSRIWRAFGLQPHRSEVFQLSADPQLVDKVRDVVGLYLSPPKNAVVFCVDEKTAVQALERSQPLLPLQPRQPERRSHDYFRHGSLDLFAALNVATGEVFGQMKARHRSAEFVQFLDAIEQQVPRYLAVHVVLDKSFHPQNSSREALASAASALRPSLHADARVLAQSGRTMVCWPHRAAAPARQSPLQEGAARRYRGLHRQDKWQTQTLRLGEVRRPNPP